MDKVLTFGQQTKIRAGAAGDLLRRSGMLEEKLARLRHEHDELLRALSDAAQMQRRLCGPRRMRSARSVALAFQMT